ncbi:hypothetical protein SmJEL517_g02587 [Synchytrium microbalum]|uniref:Uncharacterized protein n=1 Tax=Synchytrium microbalum TaxID=1806994 RepID=A0A507CA47_9FUNG|nr:uncharacterized protein SmJEL517_g02587 [Synchytrium microbalum]TPX34854.1 hypothetical protein SmJEL517_g02587 [Synchytrium microbalum]
MSGEELENGVYHDEEVDIALDGPVSLNTGKPKITIPATNYNDDENETDSIALDDQIDIGEGFVWALHTFVANLEGQVCVLKGDALELLDDSNSYWWLVKCMKTDEIGYIPAENIETPFERLARLNRQRNVALIAPGDADIDEITQQDEFKVKLHVNFAESHTVIIEEIDEYEDGDEDLSTGGDSSEAPERDSDGESLGESVSSLDSKKKTKKLGFFSRLLGRSTSSMTSSFASLTGSGHSSKEALVKANDITVRSASRNDETSPSLDSAVATESPINVLRIYAGNVDLKANFKTVAIKKGMSVRDLVDAALKKFRISNAKDGEYYVGLLFMDSQEKILEPEDSFYDHVDSLRHRHLPGVADFSKLSRHVSKRGLVSSVRVNDDTILKVLLNKRYGDRDQRLVRVFLYDESDQTGKIRYYKTIAVTDTTTVAETTSVALRKFNITDTLTTYRYRLRSVITGVEDILDDDAMTADVLVKADAEGKDVTFVLTRELLEGATPLPLGALGAAPDIAPDGSLTKADMETILKSRPAFLESPTNSNDSTPNISASPSLESLSAAATGDSNNINRVRNVPANLRTSTATPTNDIPVIAPPSVEPPSMVVVPGVLPFDSLLRPKLAHTTAPSPLSIAHLPALPASAASTAPSSVNATPLSPHAPTPLNIDSKSAPSSPLVSNDTTNNTNKSAPTTPMQSNPTSPLNAISSPTSTIANKPASLLTITNPQQPDASSRKTSSASVQSIPQSATSTTSKELRRTESNHGLKPNGINSATPSLRAVALSPVAAVAPSLTVETTDATPRSSVGSSVPRSSAASSIPRSSTGTAPTYTLDMPDFSTISTVSTPPLQPSINGTASSSLDRNNQSSFDIMEQYLDEILKESADTSKLEDLEAKLKQNLDSKSSIPTPPMTTKKRDSLRQDVLKRLSISGVSSIAPGSNITSSTTTQSLRDVYADFEAYLDGVESGPVTPVSNTNGMILKNPLNGLASITIPGTPVTPITDYGSLNGSAFSSIIEMDSAPASAGMQQPGAMSPMEYSTTSANGVIPNGIQSVPRSLSGDGVTNGSAPASGALLPPHLAWDEKAGANMGSLGRDLENLLTSALMQYDETS